MWAMASPVRFSHDISAGGPSSQLPSGENPGLPTESSPLLPLDDRLLTVPSQSFPIQINIINIVR